MVTVSGGGCGEGRVLVRYREGRPDRRNTVGSVVIGESEFHGQSRDVLRTLVGIGV